MPQLLFLSHRLPYPPDKGEKIRAWHILKRLARTHDVHLGCLSDERVDSSQLGELRKICASVGCFRMSPVVQKVRALARMRSGRPLTVDVFHSGRLSKWVGETLSRNPIRAIFAFSSAVAPYVRGRRRLYRVLDMVDIDSEKWRAYAQYHGWPMHDVYRREAETLLALERQLALEFDRTLFVSCPEAQRFIELAPESRERVGWLANGVDLDMFSPKHSFPSPFGQTVANLVFTGTMSYWPNIDAVTWFVDTVLPIIRSSRPMVHFHIVGASPSRSVSRLSQTPGVSVTGRVPDVRPFLAHADVAVAPLRLARGIQNKVLEAMAMGRPVVATPEAFEGIDALPGRDVLVANTAELMAQNILGVLEKRYPSLGSAARSAIERNHSWSHTLKALDTLFPAAPFNTTRAINH